MTINYDEIVKDFDTEGLTKTKITASFVRKNFKQEITDLREVMTFGNGNKDDNEKSKPSLKASGEPEIINQTAIKMSDIFMGQEMPTDIWLGFVRDMIKGDFVRTVQDQRGILLVSYDKTEVKSEAEVFAQNVEDVPEKDIVAGLKKALKDKFKK